MKKVKKKSHKTSDPTWNTHTYGNSKKPFLIEWIKTEVLGATKIIFLYKSKETNEIVKYRIL